MSYAMLFTVFVAVLVVPMMIGAKIVDAEKSGFLPCITAVILIAIVSIGIQSSVPGELLAFLVTAGASTLIVSKILQTSVLRGLAVSSIALLLQSGTMYMLGSMFMEQVPHAA